MDDYGKERVRKEYVKTLLAPDTLKTVSDARLLQLVRRGHSSILREEAKRRNLL